MLLTTQAVRQFLETLTKPNNNSITKKELSKSIRQITNVFVHSLLEFTDQKQLITTAEERFITKNNA